MPDIQWVVLSWRNQSTSYPFTVIVGTRHARNLKKTLSNHAMRLRGLWYSTRRLSPYRYQICFSPFFALTNMWIEMFGGMSASLIDGCLPCNAGPTQVPGKEFLILNRHIYPIPNMPTTTKACGWKHFSPPLTVDSFGWCCAGFFCGKCGNCKKRIFNWNLHGTCTNQQSH